MNVPARAKHIISGLLAMWFAAPLAGQTCPNCQDSQCPSNYVWLDNQPADATVVGFTNASGCVYCGNHNGLCACGLLIQCPWGSDVADVDLDSLEFAATSGDEDELRNVITSQRGRVTHEVEHRAIAVWGCGGSLLALFALDPGVSAGLNGPDASGLLERLRHVTSRRTGGPG